MAPLPRLHYVSQGTTPEAHLEQIQRLVQAGCPWVQLRLKGVSTAVYKVAAAQALALCRAHGALLTINDRPDIAAAVGADGVHVGTTDTHPSDARAQLPEGIIGATANTWAEVERAVAGGVDYIGLGPFRFTTTKQQLRPVLGYEGYRQLLEQMKKQGWTTPVLAIGGIRATDLPQLMQTGIWGVAVSGALSQTADSKAICEAFLQQMEG